ncbi:unnamed protein product [Effrenium voratum]|nr:unnamed protein product [Effrenium voratum]
MGAQNCRCNCERECTRFISASAGLFSLAVGAWLALPFLWTKVEDFENPCAEASWSAAFPAVAAGSAFFWLWVFCKAKEWAVGWGLLGSCLVFSFLSVTSVVLLILSSSCSALERGFVISMSCMFLVPLGMACCCFGLSRIESCCSSERAPTPTSPTPARPARAPKIRVRRAQRLLREALILGDLQIADLLLDFREKKCRVLWRLYRCIFMTFAHCQLRCSCCASLPEDDEKAAASHGASPASASPASRNSVSRASLFFSYNDEEAGEMPIHYLARGSGFDSGGMTTAAAEAAQSCLSSAKRKSLPELTDERRARLLRELTVSGRLPFGQLYVVNSHLQTPLHCAASSGSSAVVEELLVLLGVQPEVIGAIDDVELALQQTEILTAEDVQGDSPCEAALKHGHVSTAHLLAGPYGSWPGLVRLPQQRRVLGETIAGALSRMSPEPPTSIAAKMAPTIHETTTHLLTHLERQIQELQTLCGLVHGAEATSLLPRNAAEALLRCHEFDVQAAARAFRASPREALDAAGLQSLDILLETQSSASAPLRTTGNPQSDGFAPNRCMVCFDDLEMSQSACKLLLCKHLTCDSCLSMHVKVRLDEGDVAGVVCPEPNCKLPVSEDILKLVFGPDSPELSRLQQLKTQKFVDVNKNMAWCPAPGCGRAVSLPSSQEGEDKVRGTSVVCACGVQFCFQCKTLGSHEPAPCHLHADFLKDLAQVRKQMQDETNQWLSKNSKTCSCGASIQRNGGCNHMICSVCGRHFCYVCGQDWRPHMSQPGGFDYYQCRLSASAEHTTQAAAPASDDKLWKLQRDSLPGWSANERQPERMKQLFRALLVLAEEFSLGISIQESSPEDGDSAFFSASSLTGAGRESAWQALLACIQARRVLQNCYALKYRWSFAQWSRSRLRSWVPELEGIVGALESALGLTVLEAQASGAGFATASAAVALSQQPKPLPRNPRDLLKLMDLRQLLPQAVVISEQLGALRQLSTAVALQRVGERKGSVISTGILLRSRNCCPT